MDLHSPRPLVLVEFAGNRVPKVKAVSIKVIYSYVYNVYWFLASIADWLFCPTLDLFLYSLTLHLGEVVEILLSSAGHWISSGIKFRFLGV